MADQKKLTGWRDLDGMRRRREQRNGSWGWKRRLAIAAVSLLLLATLVTFAWVFSWPFVK